MVKTTSMPTLIPLMTISATLAAYASGLVLSFALLRGPKIEMMKEPIQAAQHIVMQKLNDARRQRGSPNSMIAMTLFADGQRVGFE